MPNSAPEIDFWYSIGSTYSYLTVMRLPAVAERESVAIRWRPFNVRAIMVEQRNIPFRGKPEKSAYMWRDISRRAAMHGLTPQLPAPYPLDNLAFVNQVALVGMDEGWGIEFTRAAFRNWFEKGRMPDHDETLADSLRSAGQEPRDVIERASTPEIVQRLDAETRFAQDAGIFGSPSFVTGGEVFWGDDTLEDAVTWARTGRLG